MHVSAFFNLEGGGGGGGGRIVNTRRSFEGHLKVDYGMRNN